MQSDGHSLENRLEKKYPGITNLDKPTCNLLQRYRFTRQIFAYKCRILSICFLLGRKRLVVHLLHLTHRRVAHPLRLHRKGWVIERTGVPGERFCSLEWRSETIFPYPITPSTRKNPFARACLSS